MTCKKCRRMLSEAVRSKLSSQAESNARMHLQGCPKCRQFFETLTLIQRGLDDLAAKNSPPGTMEAVKARVMVEFDQANDTLGRGKRRHLHVWIPAGVGVVLASAILISVWVRPPAKHHPDVASAPVERGNENGFIPVPYVVPPAPYEQTYVVRTDVALAELSAAGFQVHVPEVAGFVSADVMRGQDGRLLAVRFVNEPNQVRGESQ